MCLIRKRETIVANRGNHSTAGFANCSIGQTDNEEPSVGSRVEMLTSTSTR